MSPWQFPALSWHSAPRDDRLGSKGTLHFASFFFFPPAALLSLCQGRMEEMNETPRGTLRSPQKLGPKPTPQFPGRLGLTQPLNLVWWWRPGCHQRRLTPWQSGGEGRPKHFPPSIRKALERVTQVLSSHRLQPCQTHPLTVPCSRAQTVPRPPAAGTQPFPPHSPTKHHSKSPHSPP